MDPKDDTNNQAAAGPTSGTNQELNLVGNFLPIEYVGDKFPPSPPLEYSSKHVVKNFVCLSTMGKGRLFVPLELIDQLTKNFPIVNTYQLMAAPGLQSKPETDLTNAKSRSDVLTMSTLHHRQYYKSFIEAIQPIDDLVPESGKFKLFSGTNFLVSPTWSFVFEVCQREINADVILRASLIAELD